MEARASEDVCWSPHEYYFEERKEYLDHTYSWLNVTTVRSVYYVGKPAYALVSKIDDLAFDAVTSLGSGPVGVVSAVAKSLGTDAAMALLRNALEYPQELAAEIGGRTMERGMSGLNDNYRVYARGISGLSDAAKLEFRQRQVYVDLMGPARDLYNTARDDESGFSVDPAVLDTIPTLESVLASTTSLNLVAASMEVAEAIQHAGIDLERYAPYAEYQQAVAAVHEANGIIPCRPSEPQHATEPVVFDDKGAKDTIDETRTLVSPDELPSHCREWNTSFFEIIETGHPEDIIACVQAGADPNVRTPSGSSAPLLAALMHNRDPSLIEAIVNAGGDPNDRVGSGHYAIHLASALADDLAIVKLLLEAGADPNVREGMDGTPMHLAAKHSENPAVIRALAQAGADVNVRDGWDGNTPLHAAASRNNGGALIAALLEAGANHQIENNFGHTPLLTALYFGPDEENLLALKWTASPSQCRGSGVDSGKLFRDMTPAEVVLCADAARGANEGAEHGSATLLHWAALSHGDPAVIDALVEIGADPNAQDGGKHTPLHFASMANDNPAVVRALLANGAEPDMLRNDDRTPLYLAAIYNQAPEVIDALVEAGADANTLVYSRQSPLHWAAARNGNPAVISALLKAGIDPNVRDSTEQTPLHWAVERNANPSVISVLLKVGAYPNAHDWQGTTPLDIAIAKGRSRKIIAALEAATKHVLECSHSAWRDGDVFTTAGPGDIFFCANELEHVELTDTFDSRSHTILHMVARDNENPEVIAELIDHGFDVNSLNYFDEAPLHLAAIHNRNPAVIHELTSAGADPQLQTDGMTPLHLAIEHGREPHIIQLLLEVGADPDTPVSWSGETALHLARRMEDADAVEVLLEGGATASSQDNNGYTAMHQAARFGSFAIITTMLGGGADPDVRGKGERTPLHEAAINDKTGAIVEALLDAGAHADSLDHLNRTPLHLAARYNSNRAVIETLLKAGADLNARNNKGKTPLEIAREGDRPAEIIAALAGDVFPAGDVGLSGDSTP